MAFLAGFRGFYTYVFEIVTLKDNSMVKMDAKADFCVVSTLFDGPNREGGGKGGSLFAF